jgi:carbonic anhydrase
VDDILPGLDSVDLTLDSEAMHTQAVEANVRWSIRQIRETPEARQYKAEGRAKLVGAIYEIETGRVRFLDD